MPKTPEEIAAETAAKLAAEQAAAAAAAKEAEKAAHLAEHGFPSETPVADMTETQQTAYWRFTAKKKTKELEGIDLTKLQADAAELATLKAANATDQDKALEEARREGEVIGAEKHLKTAVRAKFQLLTGKTDEEVETTFAHVDALSFTDDKGEIVAEKLKAFADTFGPKGDGNKPEDAVAAALARARQAAGGTGTSIADKRKATREAMTPKPINA